MRNLPAFPLVACAVLAAAATAYADCSCKIAKVKDGWCQDCKVGYVAGVELKSKNLYDALKGEAVTDTSKVKCELCKAALEKNATCAHCKVGFVHGTKYRSMAAYHLARGEATDSAKIKCAGCRAHAETHGWCDSCKMGFVANRAFADKDAYEQARSAHKTLHLAAKASGKCEGCAVAMVTDGTCSACKVSFKNGKMVGKLGKIEAKPKKP
jgi:hypothetical protein